MPYKNIEDRREASRRCYTKNITKRKSYIARRKVEMRMLINSHKTKCSSCEENDLRCLDFHHIKDKFFNLGSCSAVSQGKQRILDEIAKCVILCANCHRKLRV